jgi:hypothetical protein
MSRGLVFAVIVGMVILAGCIQEKDAASIPENPPPALTSDTPSGPVTETRIPPADFPAAGPVQFVPARVYHTGDEILITGTTILSPGNPLLVEVQSLAFGPSNKTDPAYFSGETAVIEVMKGSTEGQNTWRYLLNTSGFVPGDYSLEISGLKVQGFHETASFTLIP